MEGRQEADTLILPAGIRVVVVGPRFTMIFSGFIEQRIGNKWDLLKQVTEN